VVEVASAVVTVVDDGGIVVVAVCDEIVFDATVVVGCSRPTVVDTAPTDDDEGIIEDGADGVRAIGFTDDAHLPDTDRSDSGSAARGGTELPSSDAGPDVGRRSAPADTGPDVGSGRRPTPPSHVAARTTPAAPTTTAKPSRNQRSRCTILNFRRPQGLTDTGLHVLPPGPCSPPSKPLFLLVSGSGRSLCNRRSGIGDPTKRHESVERKAANQNIAEATCVRGHAC
jgi:hypothetical protein